MFEQVTDDKDDEDDDPDDRKPARKSDARIRPANDYGPLSGAFCVFQGGFRVLMRLWVPREQKMLKGHLPSVIYITKYTSIRRF